MLVDQPLQLTVLRQQSGLLLLQLVDVLGGLLKYCRLQHKQYLVRWVHILGLQYSVIFSSAMATLDFITDRQYLAENRSTENLS